MKRITISLAVIVLLAVAPAAQANFLSGPHAKHYAKQAVKRHDKMGYSNGHKKTISCKKINRTRQRCAMKWDVSVAVIKGHATVWLKGDSTSDWAYKLDFKAIDRRCIAYGGSKSDCTYHYHYRGDK